MQSQHAIFDWARPEDQSIRKMSTALASDVEVDKKPKDDSEDSDDPIGNLLKSNTAIFSKRQELL